MVIFSYQIGQKLVGKAFRYLEKVEFAIDTEDIDLKILFSSDPLSTVQLLVNIHQRCQVCGVDRF